MPVPLHNLSTHAFGSPRLGQQLRDLVGRGNGLDERPPVDVEKPLPMRIETGPERVELSGAIFGAILESLQTDQKSKSNSTRSGRRIKEEQG